MIKFIICRDWAYICLSLFLIIISVYAVSTFKYGFFTAFDEAYFLIKLQEAYDASDVTGKSQWNLIAIHWFPYLDLTSKYDSYLASSILRWFTTIVMTITCCIRYKCDRIFRYFSIILLAYFAYGQDFGLSYVPMQASVLCCALCSYLLFQHYSNIILKAVFSSICGFCLGVSSFIIITGAIVLIPLFGILILMNASKNTKSIIFFITCFVLGGLLSLLYIHLIVCPIGEIIEAMKLTAMYISKSGHNYDGISFLLQYFVFFAKLFIIILFIIGAFYVASYFRETIITIVIYVFSLVLFYFISPICGAETKFILLVGVAIVPVFSKIIIPNKNETKLLLLFLFLFPILAPLGTNCPLEVRLPHYVIGWLLIYFSYEGEKEFKKMRMLIFPSLLLLLIPVYHIVKMNKFDDQWHFTKGNSSFSEIALNEKQKCYFDNVYNIMKDYNYIPRKSVLFTTLYDYATIYALDAVNSSNFYHTENFHYFDKSKMLSPDFVILCPNDSILIGEELHKMPWGWPDEFDSYDIGNPELPNSILPEFIFENRILYCRKSLRHLNNI